MAEWNKITIGDFNTCLTDANIHFNSVPDISFYEPLEVHTEYSVSDEGKVIFTISVDDSSRADELSGISLYAAEYENGMLTKVNAGIKGSISGNSIDITIDTPSSPNYKIMLWDRHLYPLMNAIENI